MSHGIQRSIMAVTRKCNNPAYKPPPVLPDGERGTVRGNGTGLTYSIVHVANYTFWANLQKY